MDKDSVCVCVCLFITQYEEQRDVCIHTDYPRNFFNQRNTHLFLGLFSLILASQGYFWQPCEFLRCSSFSPLYVHFVSVCDAKLASQFLGVKCSSNSTCGTRVFHVPRIARVFHVPRIIQQIQVVKYPNIRFK
jgi:hypothetical protein